MSTIVSPHTQVPVTFLLPAFDVMLLGLLAEHDTNSGRTDRVSQLIRQEAKRLGILGDAPLPAPSEVAA